MAIITELENSLQDTRPREVKFLNSVKNRLLDRNGNTNSSVVSGKVFKSPSIRTGSPATSNFVYPGGSGSIGFQVFLPEPSFNFKSNNLKDLVLSTTTYTKRSSFAPLSYTPPVFTDFSLTVYYNLIIFEALTGNSILDLFGTTVADFEPLCQFQSLVNFLYSDALNPTLTTPVIEKRLSDTIPSRPEITDPFLGTIPNFNTNPTKITVNQYQTIINNNTVLLPNLFWSFDEELLLTANQRTYLIDLFVGSPSTGGFPILKMEALADIFYFGQTAAFTPIN